MWTSLGLFTLGLLLGYYLKRQLGPTQRKIDQLVCAAQQVYVSYLADDELYRARLYKWLKSAQAYRFSQVITDNVSGKLYLMPLEDGEAIEKMIVSLEEPS